MRNRRRKNVEKKITEKMEKFLFFDAKSIILSTFLLKKIAAARRNFLKKYLKKTPLRGENFLKKMLKIALKKSALRADLFFLGRFLLFLGRFYTKK